jgi:hypothetical protein
MAEIQLIASAGDFEEGDTAVRRAGIEDTVEDGLDKQQPEGFQHADGGHQDYREQRLQGVGPHVSEEAKESAHLREPFAFPLDCKESSANATESVINVLYPCGARLGWPGTSALLAHKEAISAVVLRRARASSRI